MTTALVIIALVFRARSRGRCGGGSWTFRWTADLWEVDTYIGTVNLWHVYNYIGEAARFGQFYFHVRDVTFGDIDNYWWTGLLGRLYGWAFGYGYTFIPMAVIPFSPIVSIIGHCS